MDKTNYIKIAEERYREDKGFSYEDFEVGVTIEHVPGRTITMTDNIWQSLIAMNQHPLHIENVFAEKTEFGKILVSSLVTFNIINGMTVYTISQKTIANLGWDKVRLTAPVFVGDTLFAETKIIDKRESKSRKNQGIVKVLTYGKNQNNIKVIEFERTMLIPKKER
ncbi:MAG: MaoC family dehydratase [Victivallales bacterium]|nr:MaoC family dehydratase [Victivallales bacterium]